MPEPSEDVAGRGRKCDLDLGLAIPVLATPLGLGGHVCLCAKPALERERDDVLTLRQGENGEPVKLAAGHDIGLRLMETRPGQAERDMRVVPKRKPRGKGAFKDLGQGGAKVTTGSVVRLYTSTHTLPIKSGIRPNLYRVPQYRLILDPYPLSHAIEQ